MYFGQKRVIKSSNQKISYFDSISRLTHHLPLVFKNYNLKQGVNKALPTLYCCISLLELVIKVFSKLNYWPRIRQLLWSTSFLVKACVRYLANFYFSPNDSPSKTMKHFLFHLKSSFHSRDIQIFVFPSSPLFLPVSHCFTAWSKINLQVYASSTV